MPWFKVDDNLAFHAKAVAAGNPAMGLWVRAGSWCAQQLTDGFLPDHMLPALGTSQQAKRLVDNRLWRRVQGGYTFHEWTERQPSKGDVEAERAAARKRMKDYRAKKKGTKQTPSTQVSEPRSPEPTPNNSVRAPEVQEMFGNPDPTRPDPTQSRPINNTPRAPRLASDLDADPDFVAFWSAYPKREDKGHARKAWMTKVVKAKVDAEDVVRGAKVYAGTVANSERKFIALPATWLNGERWLDEPGVNATPSEDDNPWDRFVPPTPPAEVADDPVKYERWMRERHDEWQASRKAGGSR